MKDNSEKRSDCQDDIFEQDLTGASSCVKLISKKCQLKRSKSSFW